MLLSVPFTKSNPPTQTCGSTNLSTLAFTLLGLSVAKSCVIPVSFWLSRLVDPTYASAECLLQLVNETAPAHFSAHPFWSALTYPTSPCLAPGALGEFVLRNFDGFMVPLEYSVFVNLNRVFFCASVVTLGTALYRDWRAALSQVVQNVLSCFFTMALLFMFIHFENDNTYFVGNIMHHADISQWTDRSNASTVDTIPQGFLFTYCANIIWLITGMAYIFKLDPFNAIKNSGIGAVSSQVILTSHYFKWFLKHRHTKFHTLARPEWSAALPFSFKYKAHRHVYVHHDDGDSFGSSAAFDGIFSAWFHMYARLHNDVFRLELGSPGHYVLAMSFDVFMGVCILLIAYALYAFTSYVYGPRVGRFGKATYAGASIFFFMLTVGMLETEEGDFRWPLQFLDLPEQPKVGEGTCNLAESNSTF